MNATSMSDRSLCMHLSLESQPRKMHCACCTRTSEAMKCLDAQSGLSHAVAIRPVPFNTYSMMIFLVRFSSKCLGCMLHQPGMSGQTVNVRSCTARAADHLWTVVQLELD